MKGLKNGSPVETIVAFKMPRDKCSVDQVKSLVTELKILQHIGRHVNIVNLVAACASRIAHGEIFVIVEYFSLGNLKDYLT